MNMPDASALPMTDRMITLTIRQMEQPNHSIRISQDALIEELRDKVHLATNVEPNLQRLIYQGRVLKNGKRLLEYQIGDQTVLHLVVRSVEPTNENRTSNASYSQMPFQHPHPIPVESEIFVQTFDGHAFASPETEGNLPLGQRQTASILSEALTILARIGQQSLPPATDSTSHEDFSAGTTPNNPLHRQLIDVFGRLHESTRTIADLAFHLTQFLRDPNQHGVALPQGVNMISNNLVEYRNALDLIIPVLGSISRDAAPFQIPSTVTFSPRHDPPETNTSISVGIMAMPIPTHRGASEAESASPAGGQTTTPPFTANTHTPVQSIVGQISSMLASLASTSNVQQPNNHASAITAAVNEALRAAGIPGSATIANLSQPARTATASSSSEPNPNLAEETWASKFRRILGLYDQDLNMCTVVGARGGLLYNLLSPYTVRDCRAMLGGHRSMLARIRSQLSGHIRQNILHGEVTEQAVNHAAQELTDLTISPQCACLSESGPTFGSLRTIIYVFLRKFFLFCASISPDDYSTFSESFSRDLGLLIEDLFAELRGSIDGISSPSILCDLGSYVLHPFLTRLSPQVVTIFLSLLVSQIMTNGRAPSTLSNASLLTLAVEEPATSSNSKEVLRSSPEPGPTLVQSEPPIHISEPAPSHGKLESRKNRLETCPVVSSSSSSSIFCPKRPKQSTSHASILASLLAEVLPESSEELIDTATSDYELVRAFDMMLETDAEEAKRQDKRDDL